MTAAAPHASDPTAENRTSFRLAAPGRIIFGAGTLAEAGDLAAGMGRRPMVLTGNTLDRAERLLTLLREKGSDPTVFTVPHEPDLKIVREGTAVARDEGCDCAVGFGGGSVLDAAKAIAVLVTNEGDVLDYLEIVGQGKPLTEPPVPLVAIPTTAGTGAEATQNSVITSTEHGVKVSLRSPMMLPAVALVDPQLTYDLPPAHTATTGMDALTQVIEPFVSRRANPFTDGLCREGMGRVARSLRRAFREADPAAREDMALASLFSGLALANAGLGAVHGIAGPLGGMIAAPHGALCAALLPAVVDMNLRALRERLPENPVLARYEEVARLLTGDGAARAEDAVSWLRDLAADLEISPLRQHGLGSKQISELVRKAQAANSMKGNPIELTAGELKQIVETAL